MATRPFPMISNFYFWRFTVSIILKAIEYKNCIQTILGFMQWIFINMQQNPEALFKPVARIYDIISTKKITHHP